ncbi:MAG: hypothetical protein ACT4QE_03925 [Anaerolineales bacterium]
MIPVLIGICPGLALIAYGALVLVASRRRWKWFVNHPQLSAAVKEHRPQRASLYYIVMGLGFLLLASLMLAATLAELNSA